MAESAWKNPVKQYSVAPFTQFLYLIDFCKFCNKRVSLIASFVPSYIDCETIIVSTFAS